MIHTNVYLAFLSAAEHKMNLKMLPSNAFFNTKEAGTYCLSWKSDGVSLRMSLSATAK